ncbi:hypothetical protein M9458_055537 [Cirrhinus mrigala]|uniref:Uncharacterized protein n=1 Tax=Cirrhinus mrigala TaxID=683832 RepID=A0ABD0MFS3_CIRMR
MLSFMVLFTLMLHTCWTELDVLNPDVPCAEVGIPNDFDTFLSHHLRDDIPKDNNPKKNEWQKFINKIQTWDRPEQCFFPFWAYNSVIAVCSSGGKIYGGRNLCISKEPLSFVYVKVNNKKQVTEVKNKKEYVILGCNKIENKCLPVHFEANRNDAKPDNNKENCS